MESVQKESKMTNDHNHTIRRYIHECDQILAKSTSVHEAVAGTEARRTRHNLKKLLEAAIRGHSTCEANGDVNGRGSSGSVTSAVSGYEKTIWKSIFYDPLNRAKTLKKKKTWTEEEATVVRQHIEDGIAYYEKLLLQYSSSWPSTFVSSGGREKLKDIVCMLADLKRYYCTDLLPHMLSANDYKRPALLYKQALELCPDASIAHSNLGSVLLQCEHNPIVAALHYITAMSVPEPFVGAKVHLSLLLQSSLDSCQQQVSSNSTHKQVISTFLAPVAAFLGLSDVDHEHQQQLCASMLNLLYEHLRHLAGCRPVHPSYPLTAGQPTPPALGSEAMLALTALLVACYKQETNSQESMCTMLLASVVLTPVITCSEALQQVIENEHSPELLKQFQQHIKELSKKPLEHSAPTSKETEHQHPGAAGPSGSTAGAGYNGLSSASTTGGSCESKEGSNQKQKRPVRRRRRLRRRPADPDSQDDDSSSGEEGSVLIRRKRSSSSSDDSSGLSDWSSSAGSCQESDNSGPDIILESDSEPEAASASATALKQINGTTSGNNSSSGGVADTTAQQQPLLGSVEMLRLLCLADYGHLTGDNSGGSVLMSNLVMLTSWLHRESVASGAIPWTVTGDQDAAVTEKARPLWCSLAALSNLIRVDLKELCSGNSTEQLPNLQEFLSKYPKGDKPDALSVLMQFDNFTLPEDEFLKTIQPSLLVRDHVRSKDPVLLCHHLQAQLAKLGISARESSDSANGNQSDLSSRLNGVSLFGDFTEDKPTTATPVAATASAAGGVENATGCSALTAVEQTLVRVVRLQHTLEGLSKLDDCPLRLNRRTALYSLAPENETAGEAGDGSYQADDDCANGAAGHQRVHSGRSKRRTNEERYSGEVMRRGSRRGGGRGHGRRHPVPAGEDGEAHPPKRHRRRDRRGRQRGRGGRFNGCAEPEQELADEPRSGLQATLTNGGSRSNQASPEFFTRKKFNPISKSTESSPRLSDRFSHQNLGSRSTEASPFSYSRWRSSPFSGLPSGSRDNSRGSSPASSTAAGRLFTSPPMTSNSSSGCEGVGACAMNGLLLDSSTAVVSDDSSIGCGPANKFGAIGDGRRAAGRQPQVEAALRAKEEEEKAKKRQASQRVLTEVWLRHTIANTQPAVLQTARFKRYLVPDTQALTHHLKDIMKLVNLQQCRVVVPMQVLSHLDEVKRTDGAARDASRWLERVLMRSGGNAYLHVQTPPERYRVPGVSYPGKHHKLPWRWFQILECCHHLARREYVPSSGGRAGGSLYSDQLQNKSPTITPRRYHQQQGAASDKLLADTCLADSLKDKTPVVTLLTGETRDTIGKLPFSLSSLASSVAAEIQFITEFQKKLQNCSSQGRT